MEQNLSPDRIWPLRPDLPFDNLDISDPRAWLVFAGLAIAFALLARFLRRYR